MSIIATAVKHLLAAGVAGDALVQAIAEMEAAPAARDEQADRRRAADRERKARLRNSAESAESADIPPPPLSSPPLSPQTPNNPPPIIPPTPVCVVRRRAVCCPDDWQPKPLPEPLASEVAAMPAGWLERQLAGMRDWSAASPNGAKLDWDATWRGWLRRTMKESNNGNSLGRHNGQGGGERRPSASLDWIERNLGRAAEADEGPHGVHRGTLVALPGSAGH